MNPESDADERRGPRLAPDHQETLLIRLPWYGGPRRETVCVMVDASANGAGILITERLANGTKVTIEGDIEINATQYRIVGSAEVVNCRVADRGLYRIGLQFVDVIWDRVDTQDAPYPAELDATETPPEHGRAS